MNTQAYFLQTRGVPEVTDTGYAFRIKQRIVIRAGMKTAYIMCTEDSVDSIFDILKNLMEACLTSNGSVFVAKELHLPNLLKWKTDQIVGVNMVEELTSKQT